MTKHSVRPVGLLLPALVWSHHSRATVVAWRALNTAMVSSKLTWIGYSTLSVHKRIWHSTDAAHPSVQTSAFNTWLGAKSHKPSIGWPTRNVLRPGPMEPQGRCLLRLLRIFFPGDGKSVGAENRHNRTVACQASMRLTTYRSCPPGVQTLASSCWAIKGTSWNL